MGPSKLLRKMISFGLCILAFSCSKEEDDSNSEDSTALNSVPVMADQSFEVTENIGNFKNIATIVASDADGDTLFFALESDIDLQIGQSTGEVRTLSKSFLDYETATSFTFDVSVRDTKGALTYATITINLIDEEDGPLTNLQKDFIDEYIYLTYKLSPTASGGGRSEKWTDSIKLFIEGDLPNNYNETLEEYIDEFRVLMAGSLTIELVTTLDKSNVHLIMGNASSISNIWPDMSTLVSGQNYGGYALYDTNANYSIFRGRIWMVNGDEGLLKHEFGHIIGLGHTSDQYCEFEVTSVMCPGAAKEFNPFDSEIIKTLYLTETPVGLSLPEMKALVTNYIIQGKIDL